MNTIQLRTILLTVSLFCCMFSYSQEIKVKNVSILMDDRTAIKQPCLDGNGDTCALIKIKSDNKLEGLDFTSHNQYVKADYKEGVYYVYVPTISRRLDFKHNDYLPGRIDLEEHGYRKLKGGKTYQVILEAVSNAANTKGKIVINVTPKSATLFFDGKKITNNNSGIYELPAEKGRHIYDARLINYNSQQDSLYLEGAKTEIVSINLQPITHRVKIECNNKNARVLVDNIDYGKVGILSLPQGTHEIRIQADGYVDWITSVNITSMLATNGMNVTMQKNKKTIDIHPTLVTVYGNFTKLYKNNKLIKDAKPGVPIKFMPGKKYVISTDTGKSKKIEVQSEPLEISL